MESVRHSDKTQYQLLFQCLGCTRLRMETILLELFVLISMELTWVPPLLPQLILQLGGYCMNKSGLVEPLLPLLSTLALKIPPLPDVINMLTLPLMIFLLFSGCVYGAAGPQPNLGPDLTICGTGGSIVLNSNVTPASDLTVLWSDGTTGSGMGAPYTKTINAAGTYSVCVTKSGSCTKSDVIVVSNTFSINIGPDQNLCGTGSVTS
jgi:hypothetical protein